MVLRANRNQKRAGAVMLISDKIDFRSEALSRYSIVIKVLVQQQARTIINTHLITGDQNIWSKNWLKWRKK